MNTPRFSVVIPIHNAEDSLISTVESVLEQSEPNFELLLLDDGSTDGSLAIMRALAAHDRRIHVRTQRNAGVSATRNLGVRLARGLFVAFLDADDVWHRDKLATHWQFHLDRPQVRCSYAKIAFLQNDEPGLRDARTHSTVPAGRLSLAQILGENPVCTSSNLVIDRECFERIGGFRTDMQYAEDQEWLARAVDAGLAVVGLDELLVGYRMSPTGLSSDLEAMYDGWKRLVADYRAQFEHAAAQALYCRYLARRALRSGASSRQALRFAMAGLCASPQTFCDDLRRGLLTLAGAMASPVMSSRLRTRLFA
ncbi:glycosyltransferase family A protein [Salinisphaera sp.]|uniref:glycosyltransferase family 2 protein n=1 Tax=Salinisphaera sp. TaxID=1914330 RepID=UPI000C4563DD|nr:glycosyltransferase family A protein [Salinisphaera sp.]MBS64561.1 glycosyl transferase family 2 [Salinisphaera sp.]